MTSKFNWNKFNLYKMIWPLPKSKVHVTHINFDRFAKSSPKGLDYKKKVRLGYYNKPVLS